MTSYAPRLVDGMLQAGMATFPAILLVGPRACGKTTSAERVTESGVRLDDPIDANRYQLAPDESLQDEALPALIDDWQMAPAVLGAVKRAVDKEPAPGKFLITGSVQAESRLPTWPLTGRAQRIRMYGLTEREIHGDTQSSFLARIRDAGLDGVSSPAHSPTVTDYVTKHWLAPCPTRGCTSSRRTIMGGTPATSTMSCSGNSVTWNRTGIPYGCGVSCRPTR